MSAPAAAFVAVGQFFSRCNVLVFLLLTTVAVTQPVLPGSNTPGTSAADAETVTASAATRTLATRSFFIVGPPLRFRSSEDHFRKLALEHPLGARPYEPLTFPHPLGGASSTCDRYRTAHARRNGLRPELQARRARPAHARRERRGRRSRSSRRRSERCRTRVLRRAHPPLVVGDRGHVRPVSTA